MIYNPDPLVIQAMVDGRREDLYRSAFAGSGVENRSIRASMIASGTMRRTLGRWLIQTGARLSGVYNREICVPCLDSGGKCVTVS